MIDENTSDNSLMKESDFNWEELKTFLGDKNVVPIIGSELLLLKDKDPETGEYITLKEFIHSKVCEILGANPQKEDYWEFLESNKKKVAYHIQTLLKDEAVRERVLPDYLIKLAQIKDFNYYICMTYDNYFERILKNERGIDPERKISVDYSIVINSNPKMEKEQPDYPIIYNLLGNVEELNGFAKTEEELLEYMYSLTTTNTFKEDFHRRMKGKHFLFIGCNFPNWLLRFMIRIITNERFNDAHLTKIIADRTTIKDKKLCLFLNHFLSEIYPVPQATSMEFVDELYKLWNTHSDDSKPKYKGKVFLSYCSDDRESIVEKLYQKLSINGVNVYYDIKELDIGDYFNKKIKDEIKNCKLFIPLISASSLDPDRYAISEWEYALKKEEFEGRPESGSSFIKPVIIDDTKPNDPRISKVFGHISAKCETDIDVIADIIIEILRDE